jgi:hypothetical protein
MTILAVDKVEYEEVGVCFTNIYEARRLIVIAFLLYRMNNNRSLPAPRCSSTTMSVDATS